MKSPGISTTGGEAQLKKQPVWQKNRYERRQAELDGCQKAREHSGSHPSGEKAKAPSQGYERLAKRAQHPNVILPRVARGAARDNGRSILQRSAPRSKMQCWGIHALG
jgi:hypothetical protein